MEWWPDYRGAANVPSFSSKCQLLLSVFPQRPCRAYYQIFPSNWFLYRGLTRLTFATSHAAEDACHIYIYCIYMCEYMGGGGTLTGGRPSFLFLSKSAGPLYKQSHSGLLFYIQPRHFRGHGYIKGTVQRDFNSVFWHLWIGRGLNKDRFWFNIFHRPPRF